MVESMAKEPILILMTINILVNGKTTNTTVMAFISIPMGKNMSVSLRKTNQTDTVLIIIKMVIYMLVNLGTK